MTAGFRGPGVDTYRRSIRERYSLENESPEYAPAPSFYNPSPYQIPPDLRTPPSPTATIIEGSYFSRSFNSTVVVVMAVLLFALVVAAFINTVARCVLRRRLNPHFPDGDSSRDKGLEKSDIEALPVIAYGSDSQGFSECVVCLSEFVSGEKLRVLPACRHGFHLQCIDTWLLTHTSCPVCRGSVVPAVDSCCSESDDQSCHGGSSGGFGSSRFGSARIANVDATEINEAGPQQPGSSIAEADQAASAASGSRPKRSIASILNAETMSNLLHGVGSRRFSLRIQG